MLCRVRRNLLISNWRTLPLCKLTQFCNVNPIARQWEQIGPKVLLLSNLRKPITSKERPESCGTSSGISLHPALQNLHSWYVGSQSRGGGSLSLHLCRAVHMTDLTCRDGLL
jgi:hypothetical protein